MEHMPGGHPNARHPRDTRADPVIAAAIEQGYLDSDEAYILPAEFPSHAVANEIRLSVNRSANWQGLSPGCRVTDLDGNRCYDPKGPGGCATDPDSPHLVHLKLWSKKNGRTHVFRQTGGDPAKLKYNPWARKGPRYDDSGCRVG
jgi:hypothetical protein